MSDNKNQKRCKRKVLKNLDRNIERTKKIASKGKILNC